MPVAASTPIVPSVPDQCGVESIAAAVMGRRDVFVAIEAPAAAARTAGGAAPRTPSHEAKPQMNDRRCERLNDA
jgi:hypothetical protein